MGRPERLDRSKVTWSTVAVNGRRSCPVARVRYPARAPCGGRRPPARALRNRFTDRYSATGPAGYPAIHHLTRALRQAAAAAGDPHGVHLWAGTGFCNATTGPAGAVIQRLAAAL